MRHLPADIRAEFDRLMRLHPDKEEYVHPLMNISDVLGAYFILADYFSDSTADQPPEKMLIGVRDMGLLISAIGRQITAFGGKQKYTKPLDICATLFYGLAKNHAFSDGNKRTALLTLLYQLDCFSYMPSASFRDLEKLVLAVASNSLDSDYNDCWKKIRGCSGTDREIQTISFILKRWTKRKDNSYHMDITAKELQEAMMLHGIECVQDSGKLKITSYKNTILHGKIVDKTHSIVFGGWSRCIGPSTLREIFAKFCLYDQYPDYRSIFSGADPRYMLIGHFESPLRRLKDR